MSHRMNLTPEQLFAIPEIKEWLSKKLSLPPPESPAVTLLKKLFADPAFAAWMRKKLFIDAARPAGSPAP